jgi:MFS family permease
MAAAGVLAPVPDARATRRLVLGATFVCAICGFAYELVIVALGTVLFGSSTAQTALVLSTFVAAMGVGAWLSAKVPDRHAVAVFAAIEACVALLGGLSALILFASYAWLDLYEPMVRAVSVLLGALVGAELPLLAAVLAALRRESTGKTVGTLLAADYVGAFVVGLAFPLLILPALGQIQAALLFGVVNAFAGALILVVLRRSLAPRAAWGLGGASPGWSPCSGWRPCSPAPSRPRRARRSTTTRSPSTCARSTRTSCSPSATATCACSSTATCSSPRSTSTATTSRSCIRRWPGRTSASSSSAAATAWRCARS